MIWSELEDFGWVALMVGIGLAIQNPRNPAALWIIGLGFALHMIAGAVPGPRPQFTPHGGWRSRAGLTYIGLAVAASATMFWLLFRPSMLSIGTLLALTVVRIVYRRAGLMPKETKS
jgi:hypothetical protein